jgi:imidazolonepropionase-like amidohydrolase
MNQLAIKTIFFAAALVLFTGIGLQSPALAADVVIKNALLYTMSRTGTIENGTLVIEGNKITAIGADVEYPFGNITIDADGKPVTPGFFDALSSLGLSEVTLSAGLEDDEAKTSRLVIAPDASYAFNPHNSFVPSTRIAGVTRTATSLKVTKSIFAGQGAIVHFGKGPNSVTHPRAFIFVDLDEKGGKYAGGSRAAAWVELTSALRESDNLVSQMRNYWNGGKNEPLYNQVDLEALLPAAQGEIPLLIHVNRLADIRRVIDLKKKRPAMRLVIFGGAEAWRAARDLAKTDIAVLVHPYANLPASFNKIATTSKNAKRLSDADVKIAFTSWGRRQRHFNASLLPQMAGNAVANGLSRNEALLAVTRAPAEIFGISDQVGTLEVGMDADVVIWSGDPFEVMEEPTHVIIQGEVLPLVSRQTRLRDRYRTLP